ncbi:MAG: ATP-dependent sacrificial sulfur transferase LarE [Bacteroidales bacterium]|nr:ATP-dependent sacrificial sulfur transferase LarE [Bacteroidales bacterium]
MIDDPKYHALQGLLLSFGSIAVAFSGGLDSTFLLTVGRKTLGDRIIALTLRAPYIPGRETEESRKICVDLKVKHIILESEIPDPIRYNPENRCYLCKSYIFERFVAEAGRLGDYQVVDGTNLDDTGDYRPGMKALKELGIRSPLLECNITKDDIRRFSKLLGLKNWDKPANACLLTRIPYHTEINEEELSGIENAELFLHQMGFRTSRVRSQGSTARIEINPVQFDHLLKQPVRQKIIDKFHELGFHFIAVDLEGYRTGSMNIKKKT